MDKKALNTISGWTSANNEFFRIISKKRKLGIASLHREALLYWDRALNYDQYIQNYFQRGIHKDAGIVYSGWDTPGYADYQNQIENYAKVVWLTKEYIDCNFEFKFPLGVHWNPNKEMWNIHPGGCRNIVAYYFAKEFITCMAYNNSGKTPKFKKTFNSIEDIKKYTKASHVMIAVTKKYDEYIPHVHMNSNTIADNVVKTHSRIRKFFKTTEIETNIDLKYWKYDKKKICRKPNKKVKLIVRNPADKFQVIRALLLLPMHETFNDLGVTIERT